MAAATATETDPVTLSDRELLVRIYRMLARIEPYLPLLERAERLVNLNPAAKWRNRHAVP